MVSKNSCLILSDPMIDGNTAGSTTLATIDGRQTTVDWAGTLKFTNLHVGRNINRNAICTFDLYDDNTTYDTPLIKQNAVAIFVYDGDVKFSGCITRITRKHMTYANRVMYSCTCESDANFLFNLCPITYVGYKYKQDTSLNVILGLCAPYALWYQRNQVVNQPAAGNLGGIENDILVDFTVTPKPILNQLQDLCGMTKYRYRTRCLVSKGTVSTLVSGTKWNFSGYTPDGFDYVDAAHANMYQNPYGKMFLLYTIGDGYVGSPLSHACLCTVYEETPNTVTVSSNNQINPANLLQNGAPAIVIHHPVIDFRKDFSIASAKKYYYDPASDPYGTATWEYTPTEDKQDLFTKITATSVDSFGNDITSALAAAYEYNSTDRTFYFSPSSATRTLAIAENMTLSDIDAGATNYVYVYDDLGYTYAIGDVVGVIGYDRYGALQCEVWTLDAAKVPTDRLVNGRATCLIHITAPLSHGYKAGSVFGNGIVATTCLKTYLTTTNIAATNHVFIGRELVHVDAVGTDAYGAYLSASNIGRGHSFTSSKGYTANTQCYPHSKGCPVLRGTEFDYEDYFTGVAGLRNSPMVANGLKATSFSINKIPCKGDLEVIVYNTLRNACLPKYKGKSKIFIDGLYLSGTPMDVGYLFQVDEFGTTRPSVSTYYQLIGYDFDAMSGVVEIEFDEYDFLTMGTISNMSRNVVI